jgi:6-phospho-beta-galactosidase
MTFPEDFVFGGATAAYQCEGETRTHGKGKVAWDDFLKAQGRFSGDPASDFYHQYPVDLDLCRKFHIKAIRISIAWSRIFPEGTGAINQEGVDFYHRVFKECHKNGVEPYVTLHHFDTPDVLHKKGDFLNKETVEAFVNYAKFCFEEYQDEVTYWFTFNEVWPVATNQYIEGTFPPGIKYDIPKAISSMHYMMLAHAKAVLAFKEGGYPGKIGVIHSLETKYPYEDNDADRLAAKKEDILANQFVLDATFLGEYTKETLDMIQKLAALNGGSFIPDPKDMTVMKKAAPLNDYLGMNHYQSHFIKAYDGENDIYHNGTGEKGTNRFRLKGIGERMFKEGIETTDWDWLIYPKGMYDMIMRIKKQYPNYKAIYITENGMGYKDTFEDGFIDDTPRCDYINKHLKALKQAIKDGAHVKGYFVWSLMDVFSWSNGYNKRYGLFYVDFDSQKRYPKCSAYYYKMVIDRKDVL